MADQLQNVPVPAAGAPPAPSEYLDPRRTPSQEITLGERMTRLELKIDEGQRANAERDIRNEHALVELRDEVRRTGEIQVSQLRRIADVEERREKRTEEIWSIVKRILIGAGAMGGGGVGLWQLLGG